MPKILFLKGLPASGKSTFSREYCAEHKDFVMVTKDDIRSLLGSNIKENFVLKIRDNIIREALTAGKSVISCDTNLNPIHESTLREIAKEFNAGFEVDDFFLSVSLEECIKRDLIRPNSVGEKVIRNMYNQYLRPAIPKIEYDKNLPDCYIFDIDGTLAKMENRSPYDWSRVGEDAVNEPVAKIARGLWESNFDKGVLHHKIFIFSGRDSVCRKETQKWLGYNAISYDELYMRTEGDIRPDTVIKKELYETYIKGKYNVLGIFDDRNCVVQMWRDELGLPCFQVAEGDF